jgi:hypothetical protein
MYDIVDLTIAPICRALGAARSLSSSALACASGWYAGAACALWSGALACGFDKLTGAASGWSGSAAYARPRIGLSSRPRVSQNGSDKLAGFGRSRMAVQRV